MKSVKNHRGKFMHTLLSSFPSSLVAFRGIMYRQTYFSVQYGFFHTWEALMLWNVMSEEIFGHNWSISWCFQVQRLHLLIFHFCFIDLMYILRNPLEWLMIFLTSWTPTGYLSNSTNSYVTSCRFSPFIGGMWSSQQASIIS